jgi:hypothetical protein
LGRSNEMLSNSVLLLIVLFFVAILYYLFFTAYCYCILNALFRVV